MGLQYNFEEHRKPNQQKGTKKVPNVEKVLKVQKKYQKCKKYKKMNEKCKNEKNYIKSQKVPKAKKTLKYFVKDL